MGQPEVFISYAWQGKSEETAREVEVQLKEKGLHIVRDQDHLGYKGSIKEFMQEIGKGRYVILVISDRYLKSENCIYELLQIAKDEENFTRRIFPLVIEDAGISRAAERIAYVHYWEDKKDYLENKMKQGSLTHLQVEPVTGTELVKYLKPTPLIVILSACHSARKEPDLLPAARALYEAGIETGALLDCPLSYYEFCIILLT